MCSDIKIIIKKRKKINVFLKTSPRIYTAKPNARHVFSPYVIANPEKTKYRTQISSYKKLLWSKGLDIDLTSIQNIVFILEAFE